MLTGKGQSMYFRIMKNILKKVDSVTLAVATRTTTTCKFLYAVTND